MLMESTACKILYFFIYLNQFEDQIPYKNGNGHVFSLKKKKLEPKSSDIYSFVVRNKRLLEEQYL